MKKKKIITISIILLLLLFSLSINYRNSNKNNIKKNEGETAVPFIEKCAFKNIDEEWVYFLCVYYNKEDSSKKIINATFDGINMKYAHLDDHYISVVNTENNELIDKLPAQFASLSNGQSTRNDLRTINLFLENNPFNNKITVNDLDNLKTEVINKDIIVELYNEAYDSNPLPMGKYMNLSFMSSEISNYQENYKFQVIYVMNYGNIAKINIEIIFDDGKLLSDKVKNNIANNDEIEFQKIIDDIEKQIINNNSFTAGIIKKINNKYNFNLLNNIFIELEKQIN